MVAPLDCLYLYIISLPQLSLLAIIRLSGPFLHYRWPRYTHFLGFFGDLSVFLFLIATGNSSLVVKNLHFPQNISVWEKKTLWKRKGKKKVILSSIYKSQITIVRTLQAFNMVPLFPQKANQHSATWCEKISAPFLLSLIIKGEIKRVSQVWIMRCTRIVKNHQEVWLPL